MMEMDSPSTLDCAESWRALHPRAVADYEGAVRELAREVLANLDGEDEFDFVKDVARELP